jgi:hypothetical protein
MTAIRDTAREIGYAAWNDPTQAPCRTRFGAKYLIRRGGGFFVDLSRRISKGAALRAGKRPDLPSFRFGPPSFATGLLPLRNSES